MKSSTILVALAGLLAVSSTPVNVAPRSTVSGGVTCYYTCPSGTYYGLTQFGLFFCIVNGSDDYCVYDSDGTLQLQSTRETGLTCPQNAAGPTCGAAPPGSFKKRAAEKRTLTEAELRVRERQFQPKMVKKE